MKKIVVMTFLVSLFLVACGTVKYYPNNCVDIAGSVCRVMDNENGVACYVYFQTAISCVKVK